VSGVTRWSCLQWARREAALSLGGARREDGGMTVWLRAGLREVVAVREALNSLEAQLVVRARLNGCTWAELAEDLELTAGGVRRRHLAIDPVFARRPVRLSSIDEYHAEFVAAMRAQGIFLESPPVSPRR
jgi:hypothetical protein